MNDLTDLAVRAARAEIELDAALKRANVAEEACAAVVSRDPEKMLDILHIIGIPARDLADIYSIVNEWREANGSQGYLDLFREHVLVADQLDRAVRVLSWYAENMPSRFGGVPVPEPLQQVARRALAEIKGVGSERDPGPIRAG